MEHEQGVDRIIMMCIAARNNDAIEGDESYLLQAKLIEIGLWRIAQVLAAADTEHHLTAAASEPIRYEFTANAHQTNREALSRSLRYIAARVPSASRHMYRLRAAYVQHGRSETRSHVITM